MSVYVVSDLHIRGADDPLYLSLLVLLRERARAGDTVVLAGDVFDLFVGGKRVFIDRYHDFFREMRAAASRGVTLHYIEGNHDFLMRRAFQGTQGVHLHSHDFEIEVAGKKFFFAHGDTVDRADYRYRALRATFRSVPMRVLVRTIPGKWVDGIGQWSSRRSRGSKPELAACLSSERIEYLRNVYRSFAAERLAQGYDYVVMGHCHDLDEMSFLIGNRQGQYINVGYPRAHGSFLSWSPGDEKIQRERLPA